MLRSQKNLLPELQATIEREIPLCAQMGIAVRSFDDRGLVVEAPLQPNRNHRGTAFAGSLNALCTTAGWGHVYLLLQRQDLTGGVVIRRSSIKYLKPVDVPVIAARSLPVVSVAETYFLEMFREKGQAKLDLSVEIVTADEVAVSFFGSYVAFNEA
jgi:thioesterase domain-containing protein